VKEAKEVKDGWKATFVSWPTLHVINAATLDPTFKIGEGRKGGRKKEKMAGRKGRRKKERTKERTGGREERMKEKRREESKKTNKKKEGKEERKDVIDNNMYTHTDRLIRLG
jgi:hypothetical protein